ncbi:hypothetical protein CEXT_771421 [Caerostris extrusa]|uniref:Uncharacterized protein n=1 Tax=Caerostris extrusa TaxID=172846 RepID=A0AAV4TJ29_CAEEX|nr:hypothetical protein CEXT_771421 [Caerostris extrusa]
MPCHLQEGFGWQTVQVCQSFLFAEFRVWLMDCFDPQIDCKLVDIAHILVESEPLIYENPENSDLYKDYNSQ